MVVIVIITLNPKLLHSLLSKAKYLRGILAVLGALTAEPPLSWAPVKDFLV